MNTALKTYKAKRNFAITPEPAGDVGAGGETLSFVIQKHWASRLHYDFRLELDGVMLSWAVPKGPSYDTHDKRMAVHVEDHPISYNDFEGTIPPKQYGAGKVIIWDKGTWTPLDEPHKALKAGNLKFELHGHKMHGRWVLVRMKGKGEKQEPWLLIKEKDEYARPAEEFSVVDEMPDSVKALPVPKAPKAPKTLKPGKARGGAHADADVGGADESDVLDAAAPRAALPATLTPQLATLVDQPPSNPGDWLFEIKFDGYRLLARIDGKDIQLFTRNGNDWSHKLQPLRDALAKMKLPDGWYDGEIVVNDDKGRPDFGLLQNAFDNERTGSIIYYLFDLPYHAGRDLRQVPLEQRRAVLEAVLKKSPSNAVRFSATMDAPPTEMIAAACRMGLEGIIGKRRDAPYSSRRNRDWIKLKCGLRQEFVIGGYTDPQGSRTGFGSLLLGTYDEDGKLHYAGNVGTGFDQASLGDLIAKLQALETGENPFAPSKEIDKRAHWVKPSLVAEVSFGEWTRAGSIRHSVFQGLRADKKASGIRREVPAHLAEAADEALLASAPARARKRAGTSAGTSKAQVEEKGEVQGKLPPSLKITNPDRVIDPASGATKLSLVRYYALVSNLMLPHLKGRPLSLVRAPSGVGGELFFQKHADVGKLPGVKQMDQALDPGHPPMLEISTTEGLLSAAQWNTVELHTQNATGKAYETPNRVVFDLDPGKGVTWPQIQEAALLTRSLLEQLGLHPFLKTSGGKGLHVVVPIKPQYDWDTVKSFSQAVVAHMAQTIPERFVLKSGPSNRVGKIYIDYLRNGRGSTTVCAWSARVRPGLGISVPVTWEELEGLHGGDHWTVLSAHTRLDAGNSPWDGYAKSARSITGAMRKLGFKPEPQ